MHLAPLVTTYQQCFTLINEARKKMNYTVPRYKKKLPHYHGNKKNEPVSYLTIALILIPSILQIIATKHKFLLHPVLSI